MRKDKYRFQRAMNKVSNFLWSFAMRLAALVLIIVIVVFSLPWLKTLWETIKP
jgi:hypothetical protein